MAIIYKLNTYIISNKEEYHCPNFSISNNPYHAIFYDNKEMAEEGLNRIRSLDYKYLKFNVKKMTILAEIEDI